MNTDERKQHWEAVYQSKAADTLSWYQPLPLDSLEWISELCPDKKVPIIDVGCGDAFLSEALLQRGYENLSALDISRSAVDRARERIGERADEISWIVGDVLHFTTEQPFFFWHDRAAFHFLTQPAEIADYAALAAKGIRVGGWLLVLAFSETGPEKCSGLPVHRYQEESLSLVFRHDFRLAESKQIRHLTPGGKEQDFILALLQRI